MTAERVLKDFKGILKTDIDTAFINQLEFAELHKLGKVELKAVVEETINKDYARQTYDDNERLFLKTVCVHCRTEDYPEVPEEGEILKLDGRIYQVVSCSNNLGVLTINLGANAA